MVKRRALGILLAGLMLGVWVPAEATPITGGFSITGNFKPINGATGALATLGAATGIDFIALIGNTSTPGVPGQFFVNSGSGSLSALSGSTGSIRDFSFAGPGSVNFPNPNIVGPLLSFQTLGSLTFTLTSIAAPLFQTNSFLVLSGQGYFSMAGFQNTLGTFNFSGNGASGTFSFSSSNQSIPEPASLVLLGTGLILASAALRRRSRKS